MRVMMQRPCRCLRSSGRRLLGPSRRRDNGCSGGVSPVGQQTAEVRQEDEHDNKSKIGMMRGDGEGPERGRADII